ncbi:uncharacterized protein [Onthophagus taurus]|uniref:uncharacterized protein isoform X1 n=1 Tax=Onthophagus taurus TaxID=166361 RepID=UPI0039BE5F95
MKNYPYVPSMVQAITVLTVLKMMTRAQISCGSGSMSGKIWYERLPNIQLQGFDNDIIKDASPPFMVLEKCQELCLRDRASNNIVRNCKSFDFQPGSRIAMYNGEPEYEESSCYLANEQAAPEGIGILMFVPNTVHFSEICITARKPDVDCPNRKYIFERHPRKKLMLDASDIKNVMVSNRSECEDKCLGEISFVCRSASFDSSTRTCSLTRFTRRTHPEKLKDSPTSDYLENTCLTAEKRCEGLAVFIKEEKKQLRGPFEVDHFSNITLEECQSMCIRAEKYFCRSVEYDERTQQCTLSEEDSISQSNDIDTSESPTHHFYDFACLDSPRGPEYQDNRVTSHLFNRKRPDTAFQRFRNSQLSAEHQSELSDKTLNECLDECLRQPSFQCRSAAYSERFRSCRLSRFNQRHDGMRIIYNADYDFYENLMHSVVGDDMESHDRPGIPPGMYPGRPGRPLPPKTPYPPSSSGGDYPGRPYPPSSGGYDRDPYPHRPRPGGYDDRYYPGPDEFYPPNIIPDIVPYPTTPGKVNVPPYYPDRRPLGERFGGFDIPYRPGYDDKFDRRRPGGIYIYEERDRYIPGDRYPSSDRYLPGDRYPPTDRYIPGDRYPSTDRYTPGDRYPSSDRYIPGDRYYPSDRYIPGDRLPSSGGRDRYPSSNRDRDRLIPGKYKPFPPDSNGYKPGGTKFSIYDFEDYGSSKYGGRYDDKYDRFDGRYRPGDRFGGNVNRYPSSEGGGGGRYEDDYYNRYRFSYYGDGQYGGPKYPFYPNRRPERPTSNGDRRPPFIDRRPLTGDRRPHTNDINHRPVSPIDHRPVPLDHRPSRPISPGPDGPIYDQFEGIASTTPFGTRCDSEEFKQTGIRQRIRKQFIVRLLTTPSLRDCQLSCIESQDFICRSFNYREGPPSYSDGEVENCELSDRDSRDLDINNPQYFEPINNFNYYERSLGRQGVDGDCLDVSQVCNEDGMEFTLRTREGFYGRIYTYGFYDKCFFRGNGGTINVLRISGAQGYPECGTQRFGDTMTNIVVVQFTDNVQTDRDKRFNLTCLFRGPGEAIVTSGYIGAGSGSPIPIEYLPAENTLSSKVRLLILYQGRPTTTIAVGDPLTFRLEAQDGYNYLTDIFATNVVARDPYTGRSVQLIDKYGCPVDSYVFPELDRGRNGDTLEAHFNAFKIPESNYLIFEANVRTCKDGCQPAYCPSSSGRTEPSFGRRKREINETMASMNGTTDDDTTISNDTIISITEKSIEEESKEAESTESPEHVRELIEVFESREELQMEARKAEPLLQSVCITPSEYQGLISAVFALVIILITVSLCVGCAYRRYWTVMKKNMAVDRSSPHLSASYPTTRNSALSGLSIFGSGFQKSFVGFNRTNIYPKDDLDCPEPAPGGPFEDPSEPIYTDPSLFERSRSLRSIAISQKQRQIIPN